MAAMKPISSHTALACAVLFTTVACQPVFVQISTDKVVATTDEHFIGVNLDASLLPLTEHWRGLDFSSAKVQVLAKSLSPSYLRVGGTQGDEITFDPTGHGSTKPNVTFTGQTWDALNSFVRIVGWDLVFQMNVLKRRGKIWDPTNADQLLSYTSTRKYNVAGFELGNEPQYFPGPARGSISGKQLGQDFLFLKDLVHVTPGFNSTLILGPDSVAIAGSGATVFRGFFAGIGSEVVDRITFHQYYAYEGDASVSLFIDPVVMDRLKRSIESVYNVTKSSNPRTPVWLGETSSCWGGGAPGFSDRYLAGFLWLDKLGVASRMGIDVVMRQDFYGANYSLIELNTFEPFPDYWLTLLYKRLVGNNVLEVSTNGTKYLRIYAHCTSKNSPYTFPDGSVTAYYLNVHKDAPSTVIQFPQFLNKTMLAYSLEPNTPGQLTDRYVNLNGERLELVNNKIPELVPHIITSGVLSIPAKTFGFLVIPEAGVKLCHS